MDVPVIRCAFLRRAVIELQAHERPSPGTATVKPPRECASAKTATECADILKAVRPSRDRKKQQGEYGDGEISASHGCPGSYILWLLLVPGVLSKIDAALAEGDGKARFRKPGKDGR
jgi:hypothetical protein